MISDPDVASVYTDFHGLMRLKAEAGNQTPEAKRETARQFEAMFVQMMLKSMREATPGDGLFDSDQVGFYRDLYDRQLAMELVKGRGLGIADMLAAQMDGQPAAAHPAPAQLHNPARAAEPPPAAGKDAPARPLLPSAPVTPLVSLQHATPPRPLIDLQAAGAPAGSRPGAGELKRLFVRPEALGKGLGRVLVDRRIEAAREMGWSTLLVNALKGNSDMLKIYEKMGFTLIEIIKPKQVWFRSAEYENVLSHEERLKL